MRQGLVGIVLIMGLLSACSGAVATRNIATPAVSNAIPTGQSKPVNLTDAELTVVRRDVVIAFAEPTRPLIDTIAGAEDAAGNRYACSNVFGNGVSGLPYAGRFTLAGFQILAKGGTTAETRAAEDLCGKLGIRPRRIP